jgi:hypothetical protein
MCWDLVRDEMGAVARVGGGVNVSRTLGAVVGTTLGAGVGFLGGTTLGDGTGDLEGAGEGSTLGACTGEGVTARGASSSFHLLKMAQRLSIAMSCELMESSVASLMAVERKLMAWRTRSS